jgi:hypothetical protein
MHPCVPFIDADTFLATDIPNYPRCGRDKIVRFGSELGLQALCFFLEPDVQGMP